MLGLMDTHVFLMDYYLIDTYVRFCNFIQLYLLELFIVIGL